MRRIFLPSKGLQLLHEAKFGLTVLHRSQFKLLQFLSFESFCEASLVKKIVINFE